MHKNAHTDLRGQQNECVCVEKLHCTCAGQLWMNILEVFVEVFGQKCVPSSKDFLALAARWKVAAMHMERQHYWAILLVAFRVEMGKRETLKIWVRCHLPRCIAPLRCYLPYLKGYKIPSCAIHFENVVHFHFCILMYVSYQICQDWPIHGPRCSQEVGFQHGHRSDGRQQATCATWICR